MTYVFLFSIVEMVEYLFSIYLDIFLNPVGSVQVLYKQVFPNSGPPPPK